MGISPNRLVAVLTPLVFAPLAGTISVLVAKYLPGIDIDSGQLQQIFIAGALIAFGKAGLWLKGWQDWEKSQDVVPEDVVNDVGLEASIGRRLGEPGRRRRRLRARRRARSRRRGRRRRRRRRGAGRTTTALAAVGRD